MGDIIPLTPAGETHTPNQKWWRAQLDLKLARIAKLVLTDGVAPSVPDNAAIDDILDVEDGFRVLWTRPRESGYRECGVVYFIDEVKKPPPPAWTPDPDYGFQVGKIYRTDDGRRVRITKLIERLDIFFAVSLDGKKRLIYDEYGRCSQADWDIEYPVPADKWDDDEDGEDL